MASNMYAQLPVLSQESSVGLLTVSPGEELYSSFGHSALFVSDPIQGINRVYNYGTFNFQTEGFYLKFLRGKLPYQLSVSDLDRMVFSARNENRGILEQKLNLSNIQKQRLFELLEENYLPQNREYAYKFFYDNCSTRLGDILKKTCGDSLRFNNYLTQEQKLFSFRNWINLYARKTKPFADMGMDLAIGIPSDEVATQRQATFLPDNLKKSFDAAQLFRGGKWQSLVMQQDTLVETIPLENIDISKMPFWLMLAFSITALLYTFWQFRTNNRSLIFDKLLFSIVGLIGWLLLLLWVATDHGVTAQNINIIWALPAVFPLVFLGRKVVVQKLFAGYSLAVLMLLAVQCFLPQHLELEWFPLCVLLAVRAYRISL